eukprot:COSAG02_NODE_2160_length_9627_cov_17.846558_4_plen_95_part_00
MRLLAEVVLETSKKQEAVMDKLNTLVETAAKKKASSERIQEQIQSMQTKMEGVGAIGKLADAVKSLDGRVRGGEAKRPEVTRPPVKEHHARGEL